MKKAIVYSSASKNTKQLAEAIKEALNEDLYCGKPTDDSLENDFLYIGFWTQAFTCPDVIKTYLEKLNNKKIFLFGTAGYNDSEEYYNKVLSAVKENINDSNEIVGEFMCLGKVSKAKQEAIKKLDVAKFESMKEALEKSQAHPTPNDINNLLHSI